MSNLWVRRRRDGALVNRQCISQLFILLYTIFFFQFNFHVLGLILETCRPVILPHLGQLRLQRSPGLSSHSWETHQRPREAGLTWTPTRGGGWPALLLSIIVIWFVFLSADQQHYTKYHWATLLPVSFTLAITLLCSKEQENVRWLLKCQVMKVAWGPTPVATQLQDHDYATLTFILQQESLKRYKILGISKSEKTFRWRDSW